MVSGQERRKHARPEQTMGSVSRYAQHRVDERVMEIMARRDASARRDRPSVHALPGRERSRSSVISHT
jgi:hypothetical protein